MADLFWKAGCGGLGKKKKEKAEKTGKQEKLEKSGKKDKAEKLEKSGKKDKTEKPGKPDKKTKADKAEKTGKKDKAEKLRKSRQSEKFEKPEEQKKPGMPERMNEDGRQMEPESQNKADRFDKRERSERRNRMDRFDEREKSESRKPSVKREAQPGIEPSGTGAKVAAVFRALGDESRMKIIRLLSEKELCAAELLESVGVVQSTLSHHMKVLTETDVVACRKEGKKVFYSIRYETMDRVADWLRDGARK